VATPGAAAIRPAPAGEAAAAPAEKAGGLPFDPARLILALLRNWFWPPLVGLALAVPLGVYGYLKFQTGYYVDVQLIRREVTTTIRASPFGDAFKPHSAGVATVMSLMQSPKLMEQVAGEATPPVNPTALLSQLTIKQEKDTDLIDVNLKTKTSPANTADLANLYCKEVEAMTSQMEADEAASLDKFLRDQIAKTDAELESVNKELLDFRRDNQFFGEDRELEAYLRQLSDTESQMGMIQALTETANFRLASLQKELASQNPLTQQLAQAKHDLAALRANYTDDNPMVKDALDRVAALDKEVATAAQAGTNQVFQFSETNPQANDIYLQLVNLKDEQAGRETQMKQLQTTRDSIQEKLKAIPEKSQRYAQIVAHQQSLLGARDLLAGRQREAQVYEDSPTGLYHIFAQATPDTVVESSRWKKIIILSVAALIFGLGLTLFVICVRELLNLRVISAGDLKRTAGVPVVLRLQDMSDRDEAALKQWRFRSWSQLLRSLNLGDATHPVVAFASAQAGEGKSYLLRQLREAAKDRRLPLVCVTNSTEQPAEHHLPLADALAAPDLVLRHLREHPGQPLDLRVPPDWRWTLEQRARWQRATEAWRSAPGFTLLVELPDMNELDSLLLAELMPTVVWVTASNALEQRDLATTLEMVESGEIKLSAAVLNREPAIYSRLGILQKLGMFLLIAGLSAGMSARASASVTNAASATTSAAAAPVFFSSQVPNLAPWQQRLTVGPGDSFNFYLYGKEGTIRDGVTIAPDGRISYLEAQSVMVNGLTVDEMRAKLDAILARYYKNPRTVAIPTEWRSKKYYILGAVMDKGSYILDRPMTLIEVVARARGIATGLYEHNTVELADMQRAFIVRDQKRLPVDFAGLFNRGDLSQNILVEPGDYIFFPSGTVNEVYLLGAVRNPGPLGLTSETTLLGVLTVRGGFLPTAYQRRVLVVRGSLQHPQTFVVDVSEILTGRAKDFNLVPKDIIYVSTKPWQYAEDLTQDAVSSFVQSMTASWAGNYVPAAFRHAALPAP
jgi:protein involved in polysaccharide export with SLBB domain/uncharacterized protein involved in exopolysaccharide biosynthesis